MDYDFSLEITNTDVMTEQFAILAQPVYFDDLAKYDKYGTIYDPTNKYQFVEKFTNFIARQSNYIT